jgi:hypothetical protein
MLVDQPPDVRKCSLSLKPEIGQFLGILNKLSSFQKTRNLFGV